MAMFCPFYVAQFAQSQPDSLGTGGLTSWLERREIPYPRDFLRLLRVGREAKSDEHSAKDKTEAALAHY